MWALNKRELMAQEKEDIHQLQERGGLVLKDNDVNAAHPSVPIHDSITDNMMTICP